MKSALKLVSIVMPLGLLGLAGYLLANHLDGATALASGMAGIWGAAKAAEGLEG